MWFANDSKKTMISREQALKGREEQVVTASKHHVSGVELKKPLNAGAKELIVGMGCFWGAEKRFWQIDGVLCTAVGYSAGFTPNPTYEEVCTGKTGHNEVVRIVYDPVTVPLEELLSVFWQAHNPTQGMRQGNDNGTQYRSGIYVADVSELKVAEASRERYQQDLKKAGHAAITTEVLLAGEFYYAESYHQQYLAKNPQGYCGLGGTGVACS